MTTRRVVQARLCRGEPDVVALSLVRLLRADDTGFDRITFILRSFSSFGSAIALSKDLPSSIAFTGEVEFRLDNPKPTAAEEAAISSSYSFIPLE